RPIDAQLATGGGSGFAVMTGDVARDGTEIGAGTALTWRQTSLNLDYTGDMRSHYQENTVDATFRFKF
ncbi:MAG: hypothetical protein KGJ84_10230, partial [Elusimicrobia bacterium]|nr:hypothetical protein [Elusimicrobiota bacterium]